MLKKYGSLTTIIALIFIVSCGTKPQSDVDTPEYHYKAGMRAIENGDFQQAIKSFQRSVGPRQKICIRIWGTRPSARKLRK